MSPAEVQAWATVVLVAITAAYAWMTYRTVDESRRARRQAMLPKLAINPLSLGPTFTVFEIVNVGPGPALDAELSLTFEPRDSATVDADVRVWGTPVMTAGESYEMLPPDAMDVGDLGDTYAAVRLSGTYRDVLGVEHGASDVVDVRDWWDRLAASGRRREPDYVKRTADELQKVRKLLERLSRDIRRDMS